MSRFDEFIYTIPRRYTEWGDTYANPRAFFMGTDSMWNSRLNMGFSVVLHENLAEYPHFHHSVEEYYMFSGSDLTRFFDFDAEIEMWLGEDPDAMEKFIITKPTLVRIPPNVWHGPVNYKRIGKPVAFSSCYFDGELSKITRRLRPDGTAVYPYLGSSLEHCVFNKLKSCLHCGQCVRTFEKNEGIRYHPYLGFAFEWAERLASSEPPPHSGKYDGLFFEYPKEYHKYGSTYANPRGKFRGQTQMPGSRFYGGFSVALEPTEMETPHIHHANDEYLWFIGSDLENVFDFDAEIELSLGWRPDEMETVVITEPTVVRIPPNLWHCPIRFRRIGKPVAFLPIYPDGDWSKIAAGTDDSGAREYHFEAASLRRCSYDSGRICSYCGRCTEDDSVPSFGVFAGGKKKGEAAK